MRARAEGYLLGIAFLALIELAAAAGRLIGRTRPEGKRR